jgi:hypothetical protein
VLTHCNAGSLATGGYGTALGVIREGYAAGLIERVYADETRPWLQGLASDRLGIGAGRDSGDAAGGWSGGGVDAGGQSALGHRRRGSDRRQRRCRQQDRHLSSGGGRAVSRRAVHGGGAGFDGGYEPDQRNRDSHRAARPRGVADFGGQSVAAVGAEVMESVVRCDPGGTGGCAGDGTWCGAETRRGEDGGTDGPCNERLTIEEDSKRWNGRANAATVARRQRSLLRLPGICPLEPKSAKASFKRATMFSSASAQVLTWVVVLLVRLVGFRIDLIQERLGILGDELADGFRIGELQVGVDVHLEHAVADRLGDLVLFRAGTAVEHQVQRLRRRCLCRCSISAWEFLRISGRSWTLPGL